MRVRELRDRETDSSGLLRKITLMTLVWVYILHIHECYCGKFSDSNLRASNVSNVPDMPPDGSLTDASTVPPVDL